MRIAKKPEAGKATVFAKQSGVTIVVVEQGVLVYGPKPALALEPGCRALEENTAAVVGAVDVLVAGASTVRAS